MIVELVKEFYFEAAHYDARSTGLGARLHGHSFRVEVVAEGKIDPARGWLIDYGEIKKGFQPIMDALDHHCLNEVEGLQNASLAEIAEWIEQRLEPVLPCMKDVRVSVAGDNAFRPVELEADPQRQLPHRVRFTFEAAQSLPHLPPGHPCRRLHGHSYRVEVGEGGFDVFKKPLHDLYEKLDHRCLNDVEGLSDATSERLCAWLWDHLAGSVPHLKIVVVQETASARCIYRGKQ